MTTRRKTLLVLGATSDIGHATALAYAQAGWDILLAARDLDEAARNAADIATRSGARVSTHLLDVLDTEQLPPFADGLPAVPDTVVCTVGLLGDHVRTQSDPIHAATILRTNFEGPALLLGLLAERMIARGGGTIVGVSSVAGDRGRASNYVYGAAKAGFSTYLSGLRSRLAPLGVRVVTVKPGFVRTRMTAKLRLPPFITAEPEEVAAAILAAAERRRGRDVVYVRRVWRPLMWIITALPEFVFKRLRF